MQSTPPPPVAPFAAIHEDIARAPQTAIVALTLLDMADTTDKLALELFYARNALSEAADAFAGLRDEAGAKAGALACLSSVRAGIDELVAEIERAG